jgi:hypothetical protein
MLQKRKRARNPVVVLDLPGPTLWEYTQHIMATGRVFNFKELLTPHSATIENVT